MPYDNDLVYAPIDLYDVCLALGTPTQDIVALANHANVNPYAKYKPVTHSSLSVDKATTPDRYKAVYYDASDGDNGDCGLQCTSISADGLVKDAKVTAMKSICNTQWRYKRNTDRYFWCRALDFDGYYKYADNFIYSYTDRILINIVNGKTLRCYINVTDPYDSDTVNNITVGDFTNPNALLYFKQIKLYGVLAKGKFFNRDAESEFIIDSSGNIESSLSFDLSDLTYGTTFDLYICLIRYYVNGGRRLIPLPKIGIRDNDKNNFPINVVVLSQATPETGIGVKNLLTDVRFSPDRFSPIWKYYKECSEAEDAAYAMYNRVGLLYISIMFTNETNFDKTVPINYFELSCYDSNVIHKVPDAVYNLQNTTAREITIPKNGTATYYFLYDSILGSINNTGVNDNIEIELFYNNSQVFGTGIYYYKKDGYGWTKR